MISLQPLIALLEQKPADFDRLWFRQVGGAGSFAKIRVDALPKPAAWIVRAAELPQRSGERAVNMKFVFDVVIAIDNAREHYPGETDDVLLEYRRAVETRLLGWEIEPDVRPLAFAGGQILDCTEADIYWRDRYQFDALITNYLPDPPAYTGLTFTGEQL